MRQCSKPNLKVERIVRLMMAAAKTTDETKRERITRLLLALGEEKVKRVA